MTTPRRPLSEAQIQQRLNASNAARLARARRAETVSPPVAPRRPLSFSQRQQIRAARATSNLGFIQRPSASRDKRAAAWKADAVERRRGRRELDGEAKAASLQFRDSPTFADELLADRQEATVRALRNRGLSDKWIFTNELHSVSWENRSLQSLLRKWDALARKGLTRYQIETELERRLGLVQEDRGDTRNYQRMLDLVREFYKTDVKGRRRRVSHLKGGIMQQRRRRAA